MFRSYFLTLLFPVILSATKAQTTVVLSAGKDNTMYEDAPGNSNGKGENFFSGNTGNNSPRRALLTFDIAAQIPAGATITSATLTLFCNKTNGGAYDMKIYPLLADWGEGASNASANNDGSGIAAAANDATWVSRFHLSGLWSSAGGDYTATASATSPVGVSNASYNWTSAQVIADVQNWLNNPAANFGWILIGNETGPGTSKRFSSRENTTSTQRPQLSVTYNSIIPPAVYTFTGSGNWNDAANWSNNNIPPTNLPGDAEIIIDPLLSGECVLNVPQTILTGGKITVQANKKFRITGNLTIQ